MALMSPRKTSCVLSIAHKTNLPSLLLIPQSPCQTHPLTVSEAAIWVHALFSDSCCPHHLAYHLPPCLPSKYLLIQHLVQVPNLLWNYSWTHQVTLTISLWFISLCKYFYPNHSSLIIFCLSSLDRERLKGRSFTSYICVSFAFRKGTKEPLYVVHVVMRSWGCRFVWYMEHSKCSIYICW